MAATYYDSRDGTTILLTRVDAAPNFHWFCLGPDLFRARSGTFRVRWEGILTPDATVRSGGLRVNADSSPRAGARVWLDGELVIDAWAGGSNVSATADWQQGVGRHVAIEYWQETADTSPTFFLQWSMLSTSMTAQQSVDEAVELAKGADAIIAVVGGANNDHAATTEGEGKDRASLLLGGAQSLLLNALRVTAVSSLVVVLMDGKPTADPALDGLPAVVAAFQGGQACGQAIAEIVLGVTEPSGRLPISFPLSAEVLPVYYSRRPSGRSLSSYCDARPGTAVRWPFGHGLSYTTFAASQLVVLTPIVPAGGSVTINATMTNTGARAGWVVPQLYLKRVVATVTTPALSLKGFARHFLQPGESAAASFTVNVSAELAVWGRDLVARVEPGNVTVFVGFSSADLPLAGSFVIV
jgi:beta-glucosidase